VLRVQAHAGRPQGSNEAIRAVSAPVIGYGTVRPKNQLQVIPHVPGKLVYAHRDLAPGKVIAEGELLFVVDPTPHEARARLARAEITALEAALQRHDAEAATLDVRLANAEKMLAIDETDYQTSLRLFGEEHVGTQRELDLVQQKYLRTNDTVVELRNARDRIPNLKIETRAQLDAAQARLQQAEYELENTRITCPFRARVEAVNALASQVVTGMAPIAVLTDVAAYEIAVSIDPSELRWLHERVRPQALIDGGGRDDAPDVKVVWSLQGRELQWRGRVTRFERVEELTHTARMIVEVAAQDRLTRTNSGTAEGMDSELSMGMYCRVELPAQPLENAIWIPRHALYDDQFVYAVDREADSAEGAVGRLVRREVPMLRVVRDEVLVDCRGCSPPGTCALTSDDPIVVSPLLKPVAGMKVKMQAGRLAQ